MNEVRLPAEKFRDILLVIDDLSTDEEVVFPRHIQVSTKWKNAHEMATELRHEMIKQAT